jgi:hypothetical protein
VDLLAARELELGPGWDLNNMFLILQLGADGHDYLTNANPGHCALGLPEGTPHTCLELVSPGTGQHLVDANDVERVQSNSNMKAIFVTASAMYLLELIRAASRAS